MTVKELIRRLKDCPQDSIVFPYEGEKDGINVAIGEDEYIWIDMTIPLEGQK